MKQITVFLVSLFLIHSLIHAQVEEMETTLQDVVISATKTETSTLEIASSYTLITSSELEKLQDHSVIDVLKIAEGLSVVQQGGPGRLSSIFMRGANSEHLLIMIDGVKVNDPSSVSNSYDISTLMTDNIDRIEIVRGPQSTLYGSDAIAGIINIITKQGAENSNVSILAEGGSNNYYKASVGLNGKLSLLNYSISAGRIQTDGISAISTKHGATENDGYSNTTISSRFGIDLTKNLNIDLTYRFIDGKTDLDQSDKYGDDPNYFYKIREHVANAQLNGNFFNKNWETRLGVSYLSRKSDSQDDIDEVRPTTSSKIISVGDRSKFFWQNNLKFIKNNTLTIGIESEDEKAKSDFEYYSEWGPFVGSFEEKSIRTTSLYLQDQFSAFNNLFGTIGIRYDDNELFGSEITYRIAPTYFISSTSTKLKATYGTGFKAPSLFRLYDP
ncbi:MAG: TonB-dependent receptor, partial [Bacteroidota bacterium]